MWIILPDPLSANSEKGRVGCKGGAEIQIAIEIRAERSSPRNESGTNCRGSAGNWGGFAKYFAETACFWLVLLSAF